MSIGGRLGIAMVLALSLSGAAAAQGALNLNIQEGDYRVRNFEFRSGEHLDELRLHYKTLGAPIRDARGRVTNAVLILHGTGGSGEQFLRPQFADVLYAHDGILDPAKYFIILADGIGHGKSSKPSDGLHAKFPHYDYDDMVRAQYELVHKGLMLDHLRLVLGTSMGCMHAFVWGETYPQFADALMPLACLPVQIAGRNRVWRKLAMDAIIGNPAWANGEYKDEPTESLRAAENLLLIAGSAPLLWQKTYPTRDAADKFVTDTVDKAIGNLDANDLLYQIAASRNYDPATRLGAITAPVMWINSADDFINPPELGIAEVKAKELKHGRYILIPESVDTHGHGTHTWAAIWKNYLAELLSESERH